MPSDMTMHEPDTGVICLKSQHNVSSSGHKRRITTGRVVQQQRGAWIISSTSLSQDEEIVTVQMERVGQWNWRLDDNVNPLFGLCERNEECTAIGGETGVLHDGEKSGVVVLGHEGCAADIPFEELSFIALDGDAESAFSDVGGANGHGCYWDEAGHGFIDTFTRVAVCSTSGSVRDN